MSSDLGNMSNKGSVGGSGWPQTQMGKSKGELKASDGRSLRVSEKATGS